MPLLKAIFWDLVMQGVKAVFASAIGTLIVAGVQAWLEPPAKPVTFWLMSGLVSFAFSWALFSLAYLRSYKFICPICQNKDEPLGVLGYLRGHGAHEWHHVGR